MDFNKVKKNIETEKNRNAVPTASATPEENAIRNKIKMAGLNVPLSVEYDPNIVAQGKEMYEADNPNRNKYTFKDAIADSPIGAAYHSIFGKKDATVGELNESQLNEFYARYTKDADEAMKYSAWARAQNDATSRENELKDLGLVRDDLLKDKKKSEEISGNISKTIASLGSAPLSVYDAGKMLGEYVTNKGEFSEATKAGLNTPFVSMKQQFQADVIGNINKNTEGTWADFSDDNFLKWGLGIDNMASWLYSMGYSAAESTVLMGTMGPVGTIMLGTSAGASATLEALQEGKDSNKALATGIINGTVEWATERFITLEWVLKSKNLSKLEGKELVKTWLVNELKSAGAEGSEEFASGVIDYIADGLINQDDSEFAKAKAEFLAAGYNDKDATIKAITSKIPEIVSDTLSGALSGALMSGVGGAVQNASINSGYARSIAESQRNGTYQDLLNNINAVEGTSGNLTTDSKTRDVIRDYRRGTENMSVAAIKEQLESKGVLTNISEKTAQAIFDKANDFALSSEQKRLLKTAEAQRVLNEFSEGKAEWVQTAQAAQDAFASPIESKYKGETENGSQTAVEDNTASEKVAEYKAKANVETVTEVSGEEILASSAKALGLTNEEVTAGYNVRSDVTPQIYANALELSKAYGRAGMSLADLAKKGVAVDQLMSKVYNESNREYVKNLKDNRKRINASNKSTKYMTSEEATNAGVNAVDMDSLTTEKKNALDSWGEFINKVFGLDVHYFDGVGTDKNGWYNDNGIFIDINATNGVRVGDIKGTTAHELTHSIKDASPELYLELRKFITDYYFSKDENRLNREVESKINSYKNHGIELDEETAIEEIIADSCAKIFDDENAIRKMANQNKSLAQKIVDWLNGIINKIKSLVSSGRSNEYAEFLDADALESVRDIFARYAGEIQSNTEVGNNLDVTDAKLENKTIKSEVADILKKTNGDITDLPLGGTMAEGENTPKKASIKESITAAGFTTDIVERNGLKMLQVTAPDGTIITPETSVGTIGDIIKNANSPLNMLMERAASTLNTLDDKTIEGIQDIYSQFIHTAVTYGNDETMGKEKLDSIWKWAGTKQFRSIKPNSDHQYGVSADLLTICKKTEQLLDAISDYQVRNKRGATPGEVMRLYYHTGEKGYQTPCPFCYVFSHWIRMGLLFETAASAEETYAGHLDSRGINDLDFWRKEWVKQKKWAKDNEKLIAKAKQDTQDIPDIIDSFSEVYAKALADMQNNAKTDAEHKKASKIAKEIEGIVKTLNERYVTAFNLVSSSDYAGWISSCILNIPSQSNVAVPDGATNEEGWMAQANAATAYGDYKKVDQDVLFDLRRVDELVRDYPAMARFRTSKGSAGGKAVENYADNAFGEVVAGVATDGSQTANNALMESFDSGDTRYIDNQLKSASQKAKKQLLRGGNRVFSWSDNRVDTGIDMLINFIQFQAMGAGIQAYTKQLEGLELISSMNGYVNGSLIAKGVGYREVNGRRELVFSDVQGINHETTFELNRRYDKAGNILVGMNDIHIETALADDRIFFVIPWHRSGLSNHLLFKMMEMLGERYVAESDTKDGATDYTPYQEEKFFSKKLNGTGIESRVVPMAMTQIWRDAEKMRVGKLAASDIAGYDYIEVENGRLSDSQIEYRKLRAKVMSGESLTFEEEVRVNGDYYLSRLKSSMEENGIDSWSGTDIDSIYPYEYWDYNSTYSTADVNGLLYLEYCRRLGIQPKFCGLNAEHKETQHGDFRNLHGYWKVLIDRRMYDTKGRYQHLAPVNILGTNKSTVPGFSMDLVTPEGLEARKAEYKAIGLNYSVTRAADTEGAKIVSDATMEDMSKYAELHRDIDADKAKAQYAEMSNRKNLAEYFDNEKAYLRSTKEKYAKELGVEEKKKSSEKLDSTMFSFKGERVSQKDPSLRVATDMMYNQLKNSKISTKKKVEMVWAATGWLSTSEGWWKEIDDSRVAIKPEFLAKFRQQSETDETQRLFEKATETRDACNKALLDGDFEKANELSYVAKDARVAYYNYIENLDNELSKLPNEKTYVGDLIDFPELFDCYPLVADIPVYLKTDMRSTLHGEYNDGLGFITLNRKSPASEISATLLHEIQHAIQYSEMWNMDADNRRTYEKRHKEIQARDVGNRHSMTAEERASTMPAKFSVKQEYSSEDTSLNQTPSTFTNYKFRPTDRILDWGGGRYDAAKTAMESVYPGITFEVDDAFNRTPEHNARIEKEFSENPATVLTINNVLNVIKEKSIREDVLRESKKYLAPDGMAYILIHPGTPEQQALGGEGVETSKGWQNAKKASWYLDSVKKFYKNVQVKGDMILASDGEIRAWKMDAETKAKMDAAKVESKSKKLDMKYSKYSVKELNPPTRKSGSMFSGGGLIEQGLGYELLDKQFGVEYNSKIAAVYRNNYGHQIFAGEDNGDVIKFNSDRVKDLWALHCSPVCHDFSNQKQRRKITPEELKLDMDAAKAVARHIKAGNEGDLKVFTLENAPGYKNSEMLKVITDQLDNMGWKWDVDVYNSADYGSATSRRRCLLRAVKDGELPAKPQKIGTDKTWDSVTRDLWDSFRVMPFAPNQLDAIANTPGLDVRNNDKAILCLGTTNGHTMVWAEEGELSPTLTTKISDARLVLPGGKVVKPSVQFFGRIMGMPDSYKYPTKAARNETVGYTIVGNGVPVELTKAVIGGLYESKYNQETGKQMYSLKDSDGNTLSEGQQKFFKDSKARDDEGRLLALYHGTPNDFTIFGEDRSSSQFGKYKFGNYNVNFFTSNREVARGYSQKNYRDGNILKGYVNVTTPFEFKNERRDPSDKMNWWNGLRNRELREFQLDLWKKMQMDLSYADTIEEVNQLLLPFRGEVREMSEGNRYELYRLADNSAFSFERSIASGDTFDEVFEDVEWNTEELLGVSEEYGDDDYYFTTNDVVNIVLALNEHEDSNYDGVIFNSLYDTASFGVPPSTVVVTLKDSNQFKNADNLNPTEDKDIRYSLKEEALQPISDADYEKMKKHFGVTNNIKVAGYLLKDGKMLDFSGKHWGDTTSRDRQVDHRDINEVLPDGGTNYGAMVRMIANGNIRLMPESGGICLSQQPTEKQREILGYYIRMFSKYDRDSEGIIVDFDEPGGDTVYSKSYRKGVDTRTVLRDIDNYFKNGKPSMVAEFHNSYSIKGNGYDGYSMSNNARAAYGNGEMPLSKWTKQTLLEGISDINPDIDCSAINVETLRERMLSYSSWHHTSMYYNETKFYTLREEMIKNLTQDDVDEIALNQKHTKVAQRDRTYDEEIDDIYRKALIMKEAGLFKTEAGAMKSITNRERFESNYLKAVDTIYKRDRAKVEQWRKNPYESIQERAKEYEKGAENWIEYFYSKMPKLNRNTNDYKLLLRRVQLYHNANDNSYSIKDSEYLELAKDPRKNDAELRKMVEEAARDAGYTIKAYHGTDANFTKFDISKAGESFNYYSKYGAGFYFTPSSDNAKKYGKNTMSVFLSASRILDASSRVENEKAYEYLVNNGYPQGEALYTLNYGARFVDALFDIAMKKYSAKYSNYEVQRILNELGYDAVSDIYGINKDKGQYVVFDPSQIKSADPVTYDDNGNVIPLSERFKSDNNDIRYSLKSEIDPRMYLASALLDNIKNAEDRKTLEEYKATYNERKGLYRQLDGLKADLETATDPEKVKADMSKVRKQIRTLEDKLNSVMTMPRMQSIIKEQKEDIERYKWALLEQGEKAEKERARLEKKLGTYADEIRRRMEKEKQMRSDFKEQRGVAYYRPRVEKLVKELTLNLKKTPEIFRKPFKGFLESLDTSNPKISEALAKLNVADLDAQTWYDKYGIDLDPELVNWVQQAKDMLDTAVFNLGNINVAESNSETLKLLHKMLRSLNTTAKMLTRAYTNHALNMTDLAKQTDDFLRTIPRADTKVPGAVKFLTWSNAQPVTVFDRFGDAGRTIMGMLKKGQSKAAFNDQLIEDFIEQNWTIKQAAKWSNDTVEVELSTGKVTMTVAQMMTFINLANDTDGLRHLTEGGGFKLAELHNGKRVLTDDARRIETEDVLAISEALNKYDPKALEVARAIQKFMEVQGSAWGNEVSIQRYGYEQFGIENYFPLHTVAADKVGNVTVQQEGNASFFGMLNRSFTKERSFRANNALVVDNIFDVFAEHMSQMSMYNAFALPVLDVDRWMRWEVNTKDATGRPKLDTLGSSMDAAFGKNVAQEYVRNLLRSLNGERMEEEQRWALQGLRLRNRVAVAANIRVAVQQPFSIVRAFDVIAPKYFSVPSDFKSTYNEMIQNSGIALWKKQGHYDVNIKGTLLNQVRGTGSAYGDFVDNLTEKTMSLAEMGDNFTWTLLWQTSKNKAIAEDKGASNEEILKKTNEIFEDIIYRTQVVDTPLTKSNWMRGKDFFRRSTSAFKSEPTTTYNMLLRQADRLMEAKRSGANVWQTVKGPMTRAVTVFAMQALVNALVTSIVDAMRDDDDYETLMEKFKQAFVGEGGFKELMKSNVGDNAVPLTSLPFLSDIYSLVSGYTPDRADLTIYQSIMDIAKKISSAISTGNWDYKATTKLFDAASQVSGIPFNNMMRDIESVWNTTVGRMYPEYKLQRTPELASAGYKALYKAMTDGNSVRVSEIIDELASNNISDKTAYTGVTTQIRNAYRDGKISSDDAIEYMMLINGYFEQEKDRKHIEKQVAGW